jgi:hypothetical protein
MDKEGLERILKAEEEYRKGEYIKAEGSGEIKLTSEWPPRANHPKSAENANQQVHKPHRKLN